MEITLLVVLLCLQSYWPVFTTADEDGDPKGGDVAKSSQDVAGGWAPETPMFLMEPSLPHGALPGATITQANRAKRRERLQNRKKRPGGQSPLGSTYPEHGDKTQQDRSVRKERDHAV